jgi:hypothetical protein
MNKTFKNKVESSSTMLKPEEELYTLIWMYSDSDATARYIYTILTRRMQVKCIDDLRRLTTNEIRHGYGTGPLMIEILMDILKDLGCIVNVKNLKRIER